MRDAVENAEWASWCSACSRQPSYTPPLSPGPQPAFLVRKCLYVAFKWTHQSRDKSLCPGGILTHS